MKDQQLKQKKVQISVNQLPQHLPHILLITQITYTGLITFTPMNVEQSVAQWNMKIFQSQNFASKKIIIKIKFCWGNSNQEHHAKESTVVLCSSAMSLFWEKFSLHSSCVSQKYLRIKNLLSQIATQLLVKRSDGTSFFSNHNMSFYFRILYIV